MKKATLTLIYDAEKLSALEQYLAKKNVRLTDELEGHIQKLYEKYVPPMVREYIDAREVQSRPRPSRNRTTPPSGEED